MSSDYYADREALLAGLTSGRADLGSTVQALAPGDLDRARRGGWPVRRVLEHVIQSEYLYANLVCHLRGVPVPPRTPLPCEGQAPDQLLCELDSSRTALLSALAGVDEEAFYRLGHVGHEEYSVLSVLESAANHDREHAAQIRAIVSTVPL